jgi:hypothetical protein
MRRIEELHLNGPFAGSRVLRNLLRLASQRGLSQSLTLNLRRCLFGVLHAYLTLPSCFVLNCEKRLLGAIVSIHFERGS